MTSIADGSVKIQTTEESNPSAPCWFGEIVLLIGYLRTHGVLSKISEQLQPFAIPFMALFGRDQLPARSTLSRFLAALTEAPVEALCTLFLDDLLSRPISRESCQQSVLVERYAFLSAHCRNGSKSVNSKDYPPKRCSAKDNVDCYMKQCM